MTPRTSALLLVLSGLLSACTGAPEPAPAEPTPAVQPTPEPAPEPEPEPKKPEPAPRDAALDDAALLMAGLPLPEGSPLQPLTERAEVVAYREQIEAAWTKYEAKTGSQLRVWAAEHVTGFDAPSVFYPFSGPDILNAVTLFPKAERYSLLGLEPIGALPAPAEQSPADAVRSLQTLKRSLVHIMGNNYFITDSMASHLGDGEEQGVAGLLLFFLARTGHEIVGGRLFELAADGSITDPGQGEDRQTGVEVRFRVRGELEAPIRTVRYFPGNANDDFFTKRGLSKHIEAQGKLTSMAKAASYLMYYPAFDDIRALVLARSTGILTESSGLPFHHLNHDGWELRLYGSYHKPIEAYADRCQPDLKKALEEKSLGKLPFRFGYQGNHLMLARRPSARPVTDPVYDGSKRVGENTLCTNNTVKAYTVGK